MADPESTASGLQLKYVALLKLLSALPENSRAEVVIESRLIIDQLTFKCNTHAHILKSMLKEVQNLIHLKSLALTFSLLNGRENPARLFLKKRERAIFGSKFRRKS